MLHANAEEVNGRRNYYNRNTRPWVGSTMSGDNQSMIGSHNQPRPEENPDW